MSKPVEWLVDHPLPIGDVAEDFVDWLTANFTPVFDGLTALLQAVIDAILFVLTWPHPFVVIAAFCLIAWLARRSIFPVLFTLLGFLLIINLGFWQATTQTLALVIAATVTCMVIGVPLGIAAARREWVYVILRPILDLMQTIPVFAYLVPILFMFGFGSVSALVATIIYATPPMIRITTMTINGERSKPPIDGSTERIGARTGSVTRKMKSDTGRNGESGPSRTQLMTARATNRSTKTFNSRLITFNMDQYCPRLNRFVGSGTSNGT